MGLQEDRAILQAEKEKILAQMEKLEAKKAAVRPELYEKVKAPLDEKMAAVEKQIAELEATAAAEAQRREEEERQRLEEERQRREAEEQQRREAEEQQRREVEERQRREVEQQQRREAEERQRKTQQREQIINAFWKKHAAELETLKTGWQQQVDTKIKEYKEYLDARFTQRDELTKKLGDVKQQMDELALRKEIGEFEEDEDTYTLFMEPLQEDHLKIQNELQAATGDLEQVEKEYQQLQSMEMPDYEAQLLEKYAAELAGVDTAGGKPGADTYAPEENPDEEVFEPMASEDELAGGRVVHEELLDHEAISEGEDIETVYEEIYEDEAEQAFFADVDNHGFVSATINPCLVETKADGRQSIHELILAGKTLIGSNEECDIYLPHPGVAPHHAMIKLDRKGHFQLKTIEGKVTLNGHGTKKATLKHGDKIAFGKLEMSVHIG